MHTRIRRSEALWTRLAEVKFLKPTQQQTQIRHSNQSLPSFQATTNHHNNTNHIQFHDKFYAYAYVGQVSKMMHQRTGRATSLAHVSRPALFEYLSHVHITNHYAYWETEKHWRDKHMLHYCIRGKYYCRVLVYLCRLEKEYNCSEKSANEFRVNELFYFRKKWRLFLSSGTKSRMIVTLIL